MSLGTSAPVKLLLERPIRAGQETAFEAWVREVLASAAATGAVEGSSVVRTSDEGFLLLRFASQSTLDAWENSQAGRALLQVGQPPNGAGASRAVRTGLETWFTVPGHATPHTPPPKWKMALVTWLALLPQVLLLGALVPPSLPYPLAPAISTAIPVCALTWLIMPRLTQLLYGWLYRERR